MDRWIEPLTLLSWAQFWFPACLVSAIWCGWRARRQGYTVWLWGSLGLLLGPGAVPVVWLTTREHPGLAVGGLGFTEPTRRLEASAELQDWARAHRAWIQLKLGMLLGVLWGPIVQAGQALTNLLPFLYQETPEEYERGIHPEHIIELKIRVFWVMVVLVGPMLVFWLAQLLEPKIFGRLWSIYAFRVAGSRWRELTPEGFHNLSDPSEQDPEPLRVHFEQRVANWSPRIVPLLLLLYFVLVGVVSAGAAGVYYWMGNSGG